MRIVVLLSLIGLVSTPSAGEAWYSPLMPSSIDGWTGGKVSVYNRSNIFDYMDGAGELYLAYDFQEVAVREYTKPEQPKVTLEVYRMSSSPDAFGVLSHLRAPDTKDPLGQGPYTDYGAGLFMQWRGRYFVRVLADRETPGTRQLTADLSKYISKATPGRNTYPTILKLLPRQDLVPRTERYFHKHTVLNFHHYLSDQNILSLGEKTDAVLAQYHLDDAKPLLLVIRYPTTKAASAALERFETTYLKAKHPATPLVQKVERDEYVGIARDDRVLRLVFQAKTEPQCRRLLSAR